MLLVSGPTFALRRRADGLNKFLEYSISKDNVFLVTVSQVLDWMKNPGKGTARGAEGWEVKGAK